MRSREEVLADLPPHIESVDDCTCPICSAYRSIVDGIEKSKLAPEEKGPIIVGCATTVLGMTLAGTDPTMRETMLLFVLETIENEMNRFVAQLDKQKLD